MLLNSTWIKGEIPREILIYFELNDNENTTYWNLSGAGKAVLREQFITLNVYIRKE